MQSVDAKLEELDVEGVMAFAERVLTDESRLWVNASLNQKQRLQAVLIPDGLKFDGQQFGTVVTCLAFKEWPETEGSEGGMASLMPVSWNQIVGWLKHIDALRQAA